MYKYTFFFVKLFFFFSSSIRLAIVCKRFVVFVFFFFFFYLILTAELLFSPRVPWMGLGFLEDYKDFVKDSRQGDGGTL